VYSQINGDASDDNIYTFFIINVTFTKMLNCLSYVFAGNFFLGFVKYSTYRKMFQIKVVNTNEICILCYVLFLYDEHFLTKFASFF